MGGGFASKKKKNPNGFRVAKWVPM